MWLYLEDFWGESGRVAGHRRTVKGFSKGSLEGRSTSTWSKSRGGHVFLSNREIPLTNNLAEDIRDPALKVTVPESWHATSFRVKVWILPSCSEISVTRLLWRGVPSSHHCTFFTPGCESSQVNVADSPTKTSVLLKPDTITAASSAWQSKRRCQRKTQTNTHKLLPAELTPAQVQDVQNS